MDAYMATSFKGEAWPSTCAENWVKQKTRPNFQQKSREYLCTKQWRSNCNECKPLYFQDFASMWRFGTWGAHVNRCKEVGCAWRNRQVSCPGGGDVAIRIFPTPFSVTVLRSQHCGRVHKVKQQHFTSERVCRWKVFQFTSKTLWRFVDEYSH